MNTPLVLALFVLAAQSPESSELVPSVPDLTIKTRETIDRPDSSVRTEIIYLRGARQRRETIVDWPAQVASTTGHARTHVTTTITQCDQRRTVFLDIEARTYGYMPIREPAYNFAALQQRARVRPPEPQPITGGDVTITIDAVDTGEHRQFGRYTAHRVITTMKTDPGPGASIRPNVDERDGWYIDLPSPNCLEDTGRIGAMLVGYVQPAGTRDRVQIKHLGTARTGHPIAETNRFTESGTTHTTTLTLIECSDRPLDAALFEVPARYRPALPRPSGGFDMTKPDTLVNRVESYWQELVRWTGYLFP